MLFGHEGVVFDGARGNITLDVPLLLEVGELVGGLNLHLHLHLRLRLHWGLAAAARTPPALPLVLFRGHVPGKLVVGTRSETGAGAGA